MKIKIGIATAFLAVAFMACQKSSISSNNNDDNTSPKEIKLTNIHFVVSSSNSNIAEHAENYDEKACTKKVDSTYAAGTQCFESVGNSCSKATNCVPVSDAISSGLFTKKEIDRKISIVQKAYNIKYTY